MDLAVGMALLLFAVLPITYGIWSDRTALRATYQHALAMEITDGEFEILAAGGWRAFPEGVTPYTVKAASATNLPPGQFILTRQGNHLRLAWASTKKSGVAPVVREGVAQ